MPDKVTLEQMVDAIDDEAFAWKGSVERFVRDNPGQPIPPHWEKRARTYKAAADVLRIMASYEDRSRAFVAQLLKDYSEGRWP